MAPVLEPVMQIELPPRTDSMGYLGVRLAEVDAERAKALKLPEERGVEIRMVMEGGPADRAGIQPGDVMLSYNGELVLGTGQFARLVQETPPGRHVKVQYWRDGKTLTTIVLIGASNEVKSNSNPLFPFSPPNWPAQGMDLPSPSLVWRNSTVGIEFERVDSQLAEYFGVKAGILVRSVQHGSAADRAGVRAGDVIFSVAQQTLSSEHDFSSLIRQRSGSVTVSLMRDRKRMDLTIALPQ